MFIPHDAAQLYTVEFGSGPRAILAHGGRIGSWELWVEPFCHLSKTWRTVSYDHRGTGATIAPVESISIENLVDDLFAIMDQMEIAKCILAAESAGGIIAITAALQQPQRFEGLVLVDAFLHNVKSGSDSAFIQGLKTNFAQTAAAFADACVPETEQHSAEIRDWAKKSLPARPPNRRFDSLNVLTVSTYAQNFLRFNCRLFSFMAITIASSRFGIRNMPHRQFPAVNYRPSKVRDMCRQ